MHTLPRIDPIFPTPALQQPSSDVLGQLQDIKQPYSACQTKYSGWRRGLENEGSRILGLLDSASWPCVGAQVKDGFQVIF